jgi:hypothetical protein
MFISITSGYVQGVLAYIRSIKLGLRKVIGETDGNGPGACTDIKYSYPLLVSRPINYGFTSTSVSGRGINTAGLTRKLSDINSRLPVIYGRGSPLTRRLIVLAKYVTFILPGRGVINWYKYKPGMSQNMS